MKRLANLKSSHTDSSQYGFSQKRSSNVAMTLKGRKGSVPNNNPYPLSSRVDTHNAGYLSSTTPLSAQRSRVSSLSQSKRSVSISHESHPKSRAATLATTAETAMSDLAPSGGGTSGTATNTNGDRNSTFSSPAPSLRSMTTTLTTVQSTAGPLNTSYQTSAQNQNISHTPNLSASTNHTYTPAGLPTHLAPHAHPTTYQTATANNILTDDASILTLASSSKRRRRNSLDTNASIRALAPTSMFGGSQESLPLSVLSGHIIHGDNSSLRDASGVLATTAGHTTRPPLGPERASLISASGITAPALASERNSYIGSRGGDKYGDAASIRSGLLRGETAAAAGPNLHGRTDSMTGSIAHSLNKEKDKEREQRIRDKDSTSGMVTAPTSPISEDGPAVQQPQAMHAVLMDRNRGLSRRSSGWDSRASIEDGRRRSASIHGSLGS